MRRDHISKHQNFHLPRTRAQLQDIQRRPQICASIMSRAPKFLQSVFLEGVVKSPQIGLELPSEICIIGVFSNFASSVDSVWILVWHWSSTLWACSTNVAFFRACVFNTASRLLRMSDRFKMDLQVLAMSC